MVKCSVETFYLSSSDSREGDCALEDRMSMKQSMMVACCLVDVEREEDIHSRADELEGRSGPLLAVAGRDKMASAQWS